MKAHKESLRILIAVTEFSPVLELWRAAMRFADGTQAEFVALFIDDDRWRRAASLPFTREISRISGTVVDFTAERAEQVKTEAVTRTHRQLEQLASNADLVLAFEVLSESDQKHIRELLEVGQDILIAPSFITNRPVYAHLAQLDCQVLLIEATEEKHESE